MVAPGSRPAKGHSKHYSEEGPPTPHSWGPVVSRALASGNSIPCRLEATLVDSCGIFPYSHRREFPGDPSPAITPGQHEEHSIPEIRLCQDCRQPIDPVREVYIVLDKYSADGQTIRPGHEWRYAHVTCPEQDTTTRRRQRRFMRPDPNIEIVCRVCDEPVRQVEYVVHISTHI
jgi:hypothetical protein